MRQFQNKKKIRSRVYSRYSVIALAILAILLAKAVFNIYIKEVESDKVRQASLKDLNELKDRKDKLASEIDNLNTASGLEAEIRSKFSVVKQGEQVIVVVPADTATTTAAEQPGFIRNLWNRFMNIFK